MARVKVNNHLRKLICMFLFLTVLANCQLLTAAAEFEDLGIPVTKAGLMGWLVGPDENHDLTKVYFNFNQDGGTLFLVQVDPESGETKQFNAPEGPGAWAFIVGPDNKIYLGTWNGALILRFDPARAHKGIEVLGRPSKTETYIWGFTIGKDGKLYGGTYGNAKLISYDPRTGEMADLGRMDPSEMYSRYVATGKDGWIYVGVGFARGSIVAYNPEAGTHCLAVPEQHIIQGCGIVWNGRDGNAYGKLGSRTYRLQDGKAVVIPDGEAKGPSPKSLKDGRIVTDPDLKGGGSYSLYDPATKEKERKHFVYTGAGMSVFSVGKGPGGIIYGSSIMPLELFSYDPRMGKMSDLGNPTSVTGEIYSFAELGHKLYMCAYPRAWLSIFDPKMPWNYGTKNTNNPYGYGPIGDGHCRPRAMIVGEDRRLYIGSYPTYGQLGGALGVYDPKEDRIVENYRNIVPNQSVVALVQELSTNLIFGGTSVGGGGGAHIVEKDAHLFAWDPKTREKVVDIVPLPGKATVLSIAQARGKIFAILNGPHMVVYDVEKREIVHMAQMSIGNPREASLELWKDGLIYGLSDRCIFTIDPKTDEVREYAKSRWPVSSGWAITETGIYFGSGVHLMRWKW